MRFLEMPFVPDDKSRAYCSECHYVAWRVSAETGLVLYCEVCDQRSQTRDALSDARRFLSERDTTRQQLDAAQEENRQLQAKVLEQQGYEQGIDDVLAAARAQLTAAENRAKQNAEQLAGVRREVAEALRALPHSYVGRASLVLRDDVLVLVDRLAAGATEK